MKHKQLRRLLALLCVSALLLSLGGCTSPVTTIKNWFASRGWQDDKPYESYDMDKYITLGDYKNIEVELDPLTEESIKTDAELYFTENALPLGAAKTGRTTIEKNDVIFFSYEGSGEGLSEATLQNMTSPFYMLVVGSGSFIPGFEDQLIGKKANVEFNVNVTFPEDYGNEELNGKPVVFKCKVASFGPESTVITDDAVSFFTEGQLGTAQEFLDWVENQLSNNNRQAAFAAAYNTSEILQIPEKEQEYWDDQLTKDAQRQNMSVEDYLVQSVGYSNGLDSYKTDVRDENIKAELFMYAVAAQEGIAVTDEDLQAFVKEIRDSNNEAGTDADIYSRYGGKGRFLRSLMQNKVADFLLEQATAAAAQ